MSDIVERLRRGAPCNDNGIRCRVLDAKSGCECAEAADEIERLQRAVQELSQPDVPPVHHDDPLMPVTAEELTAALSSTGYEGYMGLGGQILHRLGPLYRQRKP
jgi:hypothetical protein